MSLNGSYISVDLPNYENKENQSSQSESSNDLLKKIYMDIYSQNQAIDDLRKTCNGDQETSYYSDSDLNMTKFNCDSSLPKELQRKLQKLESSFLKTDDKQKSRRNFKAPSQRIKSQKDQQKRISDMISRFDFQFNTTQTAAKNHPKTGSEIPSMLHSKLIFIYNQYIKQNRVNQSKRDELVDKEEKIMQEKQELIELKYELENRRKECDALKFQKILKEEQKEGVQQNMKRIFG